MLVFLLQKLTFMLSFKMILSLKIISHSAKPNWADGWLASKVGGGGGRGRAGHHHLLTLKWCRWRLSHVYMLLIDQINWLVLGNLHTCAYITFPMKKECESTGQMFTGKEIMRNSTLHFDIKWMLDTRTTDGI